MIIKYSPSKKIKLFLKDKFISREIYEKNIKKNIQYGELIQKPKVSVVVVAYTEGVDLIRGLEHWKKQTCQDFEIILIDNGLNDEIVEEIKKFNILYIKSSVNLGCCGGRNVGAVYARADILVFGDADGYNSIDYIEKTIEIMNDDEVIAVRGMVSSINNELQKEFMPAHYDLGDNTLDSLIDTEGNSAWRTTDYIDVGGFEDALIGGEGSVLQYRMIEFYGYAKNNFRYEPDLILHHDYHRDNEKLKYKIRQGIIANNQLQNRYPFFNELISCYSTKRKKEDEIVCSKYIRKEIMKTKKIVGSKYEEYIKKQKERRYQGVELHSGNIEYNFSVIIPCYNLGSLLLKAVDSVFAQTLDNIEVIVVDDASTEKQTKKILEKIKQYVKVIHLKENGGVAQARNAGIKKAKSEYVLCLDADDIIKPTYLEKAKNVFDADEQIGIVSCGLESFGGSDKKFISKDKISIKEALVNSPVHTASCFRKKAHEQYGGYDEDLRGYEDWDHWIGIIKNDWIVRVIPEYLFNYYIRPNSKVNISNANAFKLVSSIVRNHEGLYEKYFKYVIAKKHEEWAMEVSENRICENNFDIRKNIVKIKKRFFPKKWV